MKKFKLHIGVFTLLLFAGFCFGTNVSAADLNNYNEFSVSPLHEKIDLNPGGVYQGKIRVTNSSSSINDMQYYLTVSPYSISGDNYDNPDMTTDNSYTQLSKWISIEQNEGILSPNNTIEIPYTINVPNDVPAGGQYAVILVRGIPIKEDQSEESSIASIRQIGSIIYATVNGETRNGGEIIENNIPSFFLSGPLTVSSKVKNTGNVHSDATYSLQVFPLFSDEEVYTNEEDPEINLILPDTTYYNTLEWKKSPTVGIFKVIQTINFEDQTSVNEKIVVICPIWLIFVIIFAIIALIIWLVIRSKNRKKAKR